MLKPFVVWHAQGAPGHPDRIGARQGPRRPLAPGWRPGRIPRGASWDIFHAHSRDQAIALYRDTYREMIR